MAPPPGKSGEKGPALSPSLLKAYRGRRVLLTGHTGFKGSWLAEWLLRLGAQVTGLALPAPSGSSLYHQLQLSRRLRDVQADVRDLAAVSSLVRETRPHLVFHLAAQALVRASYETPIETYATNVMGTAHLLEAVRLLRQPVAVVVITSDKCYENRHWVHGYRETDPLGGHDPYSSSKACAEFIVAAYRSSFFSSSPQRVLVATARAGNVIGGGDWAKDRILPDCIRALAQNRPILVRSPSSTRPWQHVLDPLSGYLRLGACLMSASRTREAAARYAGAFNFGPNADSHRSVAALVEEVLRHWPGSWKNDAQPGAPHEASLLHLSIDKAIHVLGWRPVWDFAEATARTTHWYRLFHERSATARELVGRDLDAFTQALQAPQTTPSSPPFPKPPRPGSFSEPI
jgi:CDP-glucose 4,6-dehydratase